MPRDIKEFKGNCLLVGGGWCENHSRSTQPWRNPEAFYTVDIEEKARPDLSANIIDPAIIKTLGRQFDFIYFEFLPSDVVTIETFATVYKLLTEKGVFLFCGGIRGLRQTVPDLLVKAGFASAMKKELDPRNPKTKFDNGSISLGCKIKSTGRSELSHLPKEAVSYIDFYQFFNPAPYSPYNAPLKFDKYSLIQAQGTLSCTTIIKGLNLSEENLVLLRKQLREPKPGQLISYLEQVPALNHFKYKELSESVETFKVMKP